MIDRRSFLKRSALALGALACPLDVGFAEAATGDDPVLVSVFLRGGADGLSLVSPHRNQARYEALRPRLALRPNQTHDLGGGFGLHPKLGPLLPAYRSGELAIVHAVGSPHGTRSHFHAQDYMERAAPGANAGAGWLNKTLAALGAQGPLSGIGLGGPQLALSGGAAALSLQSLALYRLRMGYPVRRAQAIREAYAQLAGAYPVSTRRALNTTDQLARLTPSAGSYPNSPFAKGLRDAATIIKGQVGARVIALDFDEWDTHSNQDRVLPQRAETLAHALAAFWSDLGASWRARTTVVVMTEFGRTAAENGANGTEHGHGSVMFVLGGTVRGGRVLGSWPGLGDLHQNRDLPVTTDFRDVLGEVLDRHMRIGPAAQSAIFPGRPTQRTRYLGLL